MGRGVGLGIRGVVSSSGSGAVVPRRHDLKSSILRTDEVLGHGILICSKAEGTLDPPQVRERFPSELLNYCVSTPEISTLWVGGVGSPTVVSPEVPT